MRQIDRIKELIDKNGLNPAELSELNALLYWNIRGLLRVCDAYITVETEKCLYKYHGKLNLWSDKLVNEETKRSEAKLDSIIDSPDLPDKGEA